ncbi:hypothetical protein SAMN04489729_7520 [Amycolatopsis lurida]|uniref:Uncharacterized protein n=1 Tax=Amycolatopsis lurida NRRL 2430 TaxID=1460371 RepID=A0A2P2FUY9_AMYLU|nr:hypothetical protein [Amycolatopsis lurida]KFU80533.1 hypothetical protein BB31_15235 [Amycolatopsis lurida NRRL 2430]SEE43594.1 hypothetical protein SAMN04489729_7520 [Amycolatopsis lurida]
MRLVRLAQQPSRVAEDVRAALASLGRGSNIVGGVALIGASPVDGRPVEAVLVMPKGVLIVIGVDLPDPALKLEAPLGGPWKADGWPLVHGDTSINPATDALSLSAACTHKIADVAPGAGPIGTIIAVGPYVETVDQPAADLAGSVRVLYPTATTMLAATVSLAVAPHPRSVQQARELIAALAPDAPPMPEEVLLGEGFSAYSDDEPTVIRENPLVAIAPTVPAHHPGKGPAKSAAPPPPPVKPVQQAVAVKPVPPAQPTPPPEAAPAEPDPKKPHQSKTVKWLPVAAIGLLILLLVAAISVASSGDDTASTQAPPPPPPSSSAVESTQFTSRASAADQKCASHAYGDVQSSLQQTSCSAVKRASFAGSIDGRAAAATIAVVEFPNTQQATAFKATADTPGGGGILDLATETSQWQGEAPVFEGAAYQSSLDGKSVRLVQVVWVPGPSTPDDPGLVRGAKAALELPVNG